MFVRLLIDGYNLLHATGAMPRSAGPGDLARARERLLRQLSSGLTSEERAQTQIVFDSHRQPQGDEVQQLQGMTVSYSAGFEEADDLLEQIIRKHPQPRSLTVVSSDLRIQRAAKARKAKAISCDDWLMLLLDKSQPLQKLPHEPSPPQPTEACSDEAQQADKSDSIDPLLSAEEVSEWLNEFGIANDKPEQAS